VAAGSSGARLSVPSEALRWPVARAATLAFLANCAQFAVWLLAPFYLMSVLALPAPAAGPAFMLAPLGAALGAPVGGWLADRRGPRGPVLAGLLMETTGLLLLSRCGADTPLALAIVGLGLVGLGVGVFQVPNLADLMATFARARQGAAGGLAFLARTLGSAAGAQLAAAVFDAGLGERGMVGAMQLAFLVAAGTGALAVGLALAPSATAGAPRG
jgi:predicted MFS family arabinose efflux permease